MDTTLSRRHALQLAGGAALLSACGKAASSDAGGLSMQLGWIKNAQFAGEYFATERGYYKEAGLEVRLVAGGAAGTSAEAAIDTGKAFVGTSTPQNVAAAILRGVPVKIVGAVLATSPACVLSPKGRAITSPKELAGKKVGVADHNVPSFTALLKANGVDPESVKIVPVQFDPSPLVNGEVDAWSGFVTNEPVALKAKGFDTHAFLYGDHGLRMCAQVFVVSHDTIAKDRDRLKKFLTAELKGWQDAIADPAGGAGLAVTKYGADQKLDPAQQESLLRATIPLIRSRETRANGLFTISDGLAADTVASLARTGAAIKAADLFDTTVLAEVLTANPALR